WSGIADKSDLANLRTVYHEAFLSFLAPPVLCARRNLALGSAASNLTEKGGIRYRVPAQNARKSGGTARLCPRDGLHPCTLSVNAILSIALECGNEGGLSGFAVPGNSKAESAAYL